MSRLININTYLHIYVVSGIVYIQQTTPQTIRVL